MASLVKKMVAVMAVVALLGSAGLAVAQRVHVTLDHTTNIPNGFEDTYRVVMLAGQDAWVSVESAAATDLDLFVYDSRGNLVASDTSIGPNARCTWRAPAQEVYTVKVKNLGPNAAQYRIRSN